MSGRTDPTEVVPLENPAEVSFFELSTLSDGTVRLEVKIPNAELERLALDMAREDAVDLMILLGAALQAGRDLAPPGNPQKA